MQIRVILRDGSETRIEAAQAASLMEALRDGGVDGVLALCGGCCSCATCHVYLDGEIAQPLPPASGVETELLSASLHWRPASRLSCQVEVRCLSPSTRVTIAPED